MRERSILIAVGGNSLVRAGEKGTIAQQFANARATALQIAELVSRGHRIVVTHGNGPQVGAQLLRSEAAASHAYPVPLDVCVAMTQGEIGYVLQTSLQSALRERRLSVPVAAVVTQVVVDRDDPAFGHPTKPIGPFYSREAAERKRSELGWAIIDDAARGFRRVVPSPVPQSVVELDVIGECLDQGMIVVAIGGGGIPVVCTNGSITGIEAVIDKDRASSLLARQLDLERMVISTDVEYVYRNFRKPNEHALSALDIECARRFLQDGEFHEGSMKPKIEAALEFLEAGGAEVIVTDPVHIVDALEGRTGTHIRNLDETIARR